MVVDSEYLSFERTGDKRSTGVWQVKSRRVGNCLGIIQWYGPWRQYCFFPFDNTIWNPGCLNDVFAFIKAETEKRKKGGC